MSTEILLTVSIVVGLILWLTVDYVRSLRHNKTSVLRKTWDWIRNVMDVLSGL